MDVALPIYVVDDDDEMRALVRDFLAEAELGCRTYSSGDLFLAELAHLAPGCLLLDMRMPGRNGLQVLAELARRGSGMRVIVMTGSSTVETIVEAMKLGAIDVLEKPFGLDALLTAIDAVLVQSDS